MLASACKSDNASQQKEKEPMAADGIVRLSKIEIYRNNSLTLESSLFNLDGWRCRLS